MKKTKANNMSNNASEKENKNILDLYRDIVDGTNILIWRTDAEGRFNFLNPAWEKISGYRIDEMLGKPFSDFQVPEASEYYINEFRNCLIGESVVGHETTFFSKRGEEVYLFINMIPLFDNNSVIIGTQGTAYDITERKHADELLQYISAKDELTGLYNLHTFLSMTEQQIKTAHRENKAMLVIYAGVDNMKAINDELGYDTGDKILVDAARILKKTFREADILSRTGGDEFVISTMVSSRDTEGMIMERLKGNIDKHNADKEGLLKLSLSLGAAYSKSESPVSIIDLLSAADEKMHENKQGKKG